MVSVLDSRSSGLGLSPGRGHTHFTPMYSASLHPGGWRGVEVHLKLGVTLEAVEILLVASCY